MFEQVFPSILLTSLVGAALTIILILIKPVTQKRFSSFWHYYMWLAVLILMVCPVRFGLPAADYTDIANTAQTQPDIQTFSSAGTKNTQTAVSENININAEPSAKLTNESADIGSWTDAFENMIVPATRIWIIIAVLIFACKITNYLIFMLKINKGSQKIPRSAVKNTADADTSPEYFPWYCNIYDSIKNFTKRNITVRVSKNLSSPLITGIFRPVLLLPDTKMTAEQLNNILRHEMTHFKRYDILYKWFVAFVKSVHWFNPTIYFIDRQIDLECEISCDLTATKNMNQAEKISYINTILDLLSESNKKSVPLTTGMTGNMKILKRRFTMIKYRKESSTRMRIISIISAILIVFSALFTSGVSADNIFNDNYNITVMNSRQKVELTNKPFVKNNTVYLPLREMLNLENINNTDISYNDGYVEFIVYDDNYDDGVRTDGYNTWINRVQVGSPYAYIRGDNYGSTENTELLAAPVIKNGTVYAPYDLFYKLHESYQGIFHTLEVTAENKSGPISVLSGILYKNDDLNFKITIPFSWVNIVDAKHYIFDSDSSVEFVQKATYDKYGSGTLFYIDRKPGTLSDDEIGAVVPETLLSRQGGYTYVLRTPSDVQYPIWIDRDEEDIIIADEYETMYQDIDFIINSFDNIIKNTNTAGDTQSPDSQNKAAFNSDITNPESTVMTFFNAFKANDFDLMRSCCTSNGTEYFGENSRHVFGMTECRLKNLYIDPLEHTKSSNDFNVRVTVDMKPAPTSVYSPEQTEATFYVCLLRQPDGRYLIDKFATSV